MLVESRSSVVVVVVDVFLLDMIEPPVLVFTRSRLPKALPASSKGVMASMSSCEEDEVSEKREEGALLLFLLWSSGVAVVLVLSFAEET